MAKGIGGILCDVLGKVIKPESTSGLYVQDILGVLKSYIGFVDMDIAFSPSIMVPLVEMYLTSKGFDFEISKSKKGTLVKGIGSRSRATSALINTISTGRDTPETKYKIFELFKEVFENSE